MLRNRRGPMVIKWHTQLWMKTFSITLCTDGPETSWMKRIYRRRMIQKIWQKIKTPSSDFMAKRFPWSNLNFILKKLGKILRIRIRIRNIWSSKTLYKPKLKRRRSRWNHFSNLLIIGQKCKWKSFGCNRLCKESLFQFCLLRSWSWLRPVTSFKQ